MEVIKIKNKENLILTGIIVITILLLAWNIFTLLQTRGHTEEKFQAAIESELEDLCATPAGYTEEQWKEHMGHHPERYPSCLN